jgi:hypothetical protein
LCTYKRYNPTASMSRREIEFDWDEASVHHVALHNVPPEEAEHVILNEPVDLGMEIVEGRSATSTSERQGRPAFFL